MKKYLIILVSVLSTGTIQAKSLFQQLCEFNPNWKKYEKQAPNGEAISFRSDQNFVAEHLKHVLSVLRTNNTSLFNNEQLSSRKHLIEVLDQYRLRGTFPVNYYREERTPVFIDEHQTHCAVGYLMKMTGQEKLAYSIAQSDNYVWVKDIKNPKVLAWQKQSGFTIEELKLIQGAYDYYDPFAFTAPNKHDLPQKPEVIVKHFENDLNLNGQKNIWLHGEGKNGILNGAWIQNYHGGLPWIIGCFENGKRTGQWAEYYKGTKQLCRTENWRDDKLNGLRRRFDREGKIIEEIMFKDGKAILKVNQVGDLKYSRTPLDSNIVYTQIFTEKGRLIAEGKESIYNPGNLEWFQNIELTALNSFAISARDAVKGSSITGLNNSNAFSGAVFKDFSTPPLVQYKKQENWIYYREYKSQIIASDSSALFYSKLKHDFPNFSTELELTMKNYIIPKETKSFTELHVSYKDNYIQDFIGKGYDAYTRIKFSYFSDKELEKNRIHYFNPSQVTHRLQYGGYRAINHSLFPRQEVRTIKSVGLITKENEKTGEWKYYSTGGVLEKTENYIVPVKLAVN